MPTSSFEGRSRVRVAVQRLVHSLAALALILLANGVEACPMCFRAVAEGKGSGGQHAPMAYYYSILFMLSMPFLLLACFSLGFYILHRKGASPRFDSIEPS